MAWRLYNARMIRTPVIAANWKMNAPPQGWDSEDSPYRPRDGAEVIVFPTLLDLHSCLEKFLVTGAQCGRPESSGAFTGDVSMQLLAEHGCRYVLCGHSDRRMHHSENDEMVAKQVQSALQAGLTPVVCVGETADEREIGQAKDVVKRQLQDIGEKVIIAYEPVWAIGSGKSATARDAQEMHAFIRSLLPAKSRDSVHILYGGSVNPDNAKELIDQPDIDGFLVGGSSLDPAKFKAIVEVCVKF
jgi:triosephosphate isomerase